MLSGEMTAGCSQPPLPAFIAAAFLVLVYADVVGLVGELVRGDLNHVGLGVTSHALRARRGGPADG